MVQSIWICIAILVVLLVAVLVSLNSKNDTTRRGVWLLGLIIIDLLVLLVSVSLTFL